MRVLLSAVAIAVGCSRSSSPSSSGGAGKEPAGAGAVKSKSGEPVTASGVCKRLELEGVLAGCTTKPAGKASQFNPGGGAPDQAEARLASKPTQKGMIFVFDNDDAYDEAIKGYADLEGLALYTYGSKPQRVIVWLNIDAKPADAVKAKAFVDAL